MRMSEIVALVLDERLRQESLYPHQNGNLSPMEWASVLAQEGNEALARVQQAAANLQGYRTKPPGDLLAECVQTAAVAFRIIEHLVLERSHP